MYGLLLCVVVVFGVRLFYVQVIRHEHYKNAALSDQLKQYQVPASRGIITAHEGDGMTPLVLNQTLYTLYADPTFIKHPDKVADSLASVLGGNSSDYVEKLKRPKTRYVSIAKQINKTQKQKLMGYEYPGLGVQAQSYRVYPQGELASQLLGFVSNDGKGTYGIEQALNKELAGSPGELKAITDVRGVPLAASSGNISRPATDGDNIGLTIDLPIQKQVEDILKQAQSDDQAQSVSAVVMNPNNGAIKAMANYPTYDPAHYGDVSDPSVFNNDTVSEPIEIGSVMKTLTASAALDQGVIKPDTSYFDPARWTIDGYTITNIEEDGGARQQDIASILNLSLNTGAIWMLMQMGGGQIDTQARTAWHNYMTQHYMFGQKTGIEQGYESPGYVPSPKDNGAAIDLTYANTAFGQAMTATSVQVAGALSAVLNGGTYYQPHLVESTTTPDGTTKKTPIVVKKRDVVSPAVGQALVPLMQNVVNNHRFDRKFDQNKYIVGGKTGTAQIALPSGGYDPTNYNGTYVGFVGGDKVQYVIVVFVVKPKVNAGAYAGTAAAQPVFANIAHLLIDNSYVSPKSGT